MIRAPRIEATDQSVTWAASAAVNTGKRLTITKPNPVARLYSVDVLNPMGVSDLTVKIHDLEPSGGPNSTTERVLLAQASIPKTPLLLVEDCEDVWTDGSGGQVTCEQGATTYKKVGTYSAKMTVDAGAAAGLLAYENFSAANLSPYTHLRLWIYSTKTVTAGQLQILLDDTNGCASPIETIDVPAMTLNTWYQFWLPIADPTLCTAIASIGIQQAEDLGAFVVYVDDVNAVYLSWYRTLIQGAFLGGDMRVSLSNDTALSAAEPGPFTAYVRVRGIE